MSKLVAIDWVIIVFYFLLVFGIALWSTRKKETRDTSKGYFLAGRNIGWFIIGASLFSSNIGSEHLVGLAEAGAKGGVAVGQFEVLASFILLILGWVFVPFYFRSGVYTMPEFLERRYDAKARGYLAAISIIGYVLTKISVTVFAGAIVFEALMGLPFWTGALIVVIATGVYTVFGGLRAVLYTDMIQAIILIGGAVLVTVMGLHALGGWDAMVAQVDASWMSVWQPLTRPDGTPSDYPWTGIIFGAPILGVWYWCTDQFIVQRVLSGASVQQSRRGAIFAGYLKVLPIFIFVIPGVIAYCLYDPENPKHALPILIERLLPAGLRGLVVAGLLAALMSSLSAVFNSCSTLVTWDIYKKLRPQASERKLVLVGQISTGVLVVLGILWIPLMKYVAAGARFMYIQSVQAYISPPIAAVFLIGVFWKRVNAKGAIWSLIVRFILGMGRLVLEMLKDKLPPEGVLHTLATVNFLHIAFILLLICSAVLVVVSLLSAPETDEKLKGLTYQTTEIAHEKSKKYAGLSANAWLSILLALLVGAVWLYFR